jgi:hypothetical protein
MDAKAGYGDGAPRRRVSPLLPHNSNEANAAGQSLDQALCLAAITDRRPGRIDAGS